MTSEFPTRMTVEQMYGDWDLEWEDAVAIADRSLDPRPRTALYDIVGEAGIGDGDYLLDIGGRDAAQALDLAERFGCRVRSVDPVQANLDFAVEDITAHAHGALVDIALGEINAIPDDDDTFDGVFSRDMLGHIEDLDGALAECRRVLKSGGPMIVHAVFGTPLLTDRERDELCWDIAETAERLDADDFESRAKAAGFTIERLERIGSEWLETLLEAEDGERRLLRIARLRRAHDELVDEMGEIPFRTVRGNDLYTIYRMIGKLEDRVYVLRSRADDSESGRRAVVGG